MKSRIKYLVFSLLLPGLALAQQRKDAFDVVQSALKSLKDISEVSYMYDLSITYPQGNKEKLTGRVYVNNDQRKLFNENNFQSFFYTTEWSYKANHHDKEIAIINNSKYINKGSRNDMEAVLFKNNSLSVFLDSVVMKRAVVKSYQKSNDTINVELAFPKNSTLRSIKFCYDYGHKKLISYSMRTFYPEDGRTFDEKKGVSNYIVCSSFLQGESSEKLSMDAYFEISNNKVILKKYSGYKVNSKL